MKTNINLKLSKMKKKLLKLGVMAAFVLSANIGFAQQTTGSVGKQDNATLESTGKSVRVIDNKGTIKYLQAKNGITMFTDLLPAGGVVTTWQLGGTLTEDVNITTGDKEFKIDASTGSFIVDGITQETGTAATDIAAGTAGTWTLLTRDEETGEIKRMLASDIITAGREEFIIGANGDTAITANGLAVGTAINKVSVYRNGAKLRAGIDYTVTAVNTVTLNLGAPSPYDWTTYAGDMIEVQWIY